MLTRLEYGTNTYGKFIIRGKLEVYNNFKALPLKNYIQFHPSNGDERYFFKLCARKMYLPEDTSMEQQWKNVALNFADVSELFNVMPPKRSNPMKALLKLEKELSDKDNTIEELKEKLKAEAIETRDLKMPESIRQNEIDTLRQKLLSITDRYGTPNGSTQHIVDTSTKELSQLHQSQINSLWVPQKKPTFIATDIDCYFHCNSKKHAENNGRLVALWERLHMSFGLRLFWESNVNRANLQTLLFAHDMQYLRLLFDTTQKVQNGTTIPVLKAHGAQHSSLCETFISGDSAGNTLMAAMKSAGAVCDAIDAVMAGNFHNSFCIIRPPGHHAGRHGLPRGDLCGSQGHSQGFCILNNVAIGIFML